MHPAVLESRSILVVCCWFVTVILSAAESGAELCAEFKSNPHRHSHIPFVAQAGSRYGTDFLEPQEPVVINVVDHGARGDDETDDTIAFRRAFVAAEAVKPSSDWVLLRVPAGRYLLSSILFLGRDRCILSGDGSEKSIIEFDRGLLDAYVYNGTAREKEWSFRGGLLWIEANPFSTASVPPPTVPIIGEHAAGSRTVTVLADNIEGLRSLGSNDVHLRWEGDANWCEEVFGHTAGRELTRETWPLIASDGRVRWEWSNRITKMTDAGIVVLTKPLRLPVKTDWRPVIGRRSGELNDVVIRDLGIHFPEHAVRRHNHHDGFNALFMRMVTHARIERVRIVNADAGIVLERSSHVTVEDVELTGQPSHHGISLRDCANDNLIQRVHFANEKYIHGMSQQDLSAGNVVRDCRFEHGVIDCHRGMPFDNVWTANRFIRCDGGAGGATGPYAGRRAVIWNLVVAPVPEGIVDKALRRYHRGLGLLLNPEQYCRGAIVGVQGKLTPWTDRKPDKKPWAMPPGDKGTVVTDVNVVPNPVDLYLAQKSWWSTQGKNE